MARVEVRQGSGPLEMIIHLADGPAVPSMTSRKIENSGSGKGSG